jgi:uncharacterized protein
MREVGFGARWLAGVALWLCACLPLAAQQPIPALETRVTDTTGTLDAEARAALEQKLAAFEDRKGSQIAVLVVPTTAPEAIEPYALRVAEEWRLGRGGVDDGVVLLVAKDDRRMRIEVGYALEGAVPDALARRIIDERMAPRFYEGDYAGGIDAGIEALIGLIDGEPLPVPVARAPDLEPWSALPFVLMFAAFAAPLFRKLLGTLFGATALGVGTGFVVWLLSSVLFTSLLIGGMVFVFALAGIAGGPGRWTSGGGRRGGFGGGFGGGRGGFRGGGGRFGGGGASGGW